MIVFNRNDLLERFKDIPIEDIGYEHLPCSLDDITSANIVLFVDGEQKKILKNRWGYEGIVGVNEKNWRN